MVGMKMLYCLLCLPGLLCVLAAVSRADTGWAGEDSRRYDAGLGVDPVYSTPSLDEESGTRPASFIPSEAYAEYLGNMSFHGGRGRVRVTHTVFTLPLVNPQQASWRSWHADVKGTARMTWLDSTGHNLPDEDKLYTLGLKASVSRQAGKSGRWQLGVTPQFSTDFDVMTHHNLYLGGYAAWSASSGERLRWTLGLACMPDYYRSVVLPLLSLKWRFSPAWELRVEGTRLAAVCVGHERFRWGPFFQWNAGGWTVQRERQTQQLHMNNAILGLGTSYESVLVSGGRLSFLGDLGATFANTFRIRDASGEHTLEKYRAHPGLYARLGLRFVF